MKKLQLFFPTLIVFLLSCASEEDQPITAQDPEPIEPIAVVQDEPVTPEIITEEPDTIPEEIPPFNFEVLKSKAVESLELPFSIDTVFLDKYENNYPMESNMTIREVAFLSSSFVESKPTDWSNHSAQTFIMIDSLRKNKLYDEYQQNIDIGMMLYAEANTNERITLSNSSYILLWTVYYSTYEACPYASGNIVYGSLFVNDEFMNTAVLGETSGGGDAPYWGDTKVTSIITKDLIITARQERSGGDEDEETGEEIIDETNEVFELIITPEGFKAI